MQKWLIIYLCIMAGFGLILFLFAAWQLRWIYRFKTWWWIKREPEKVYEVTMHYEGNLYEEFFVKFEWKQFEFDGGLYLTSKECVEHKKRILKRENKEILGRLHYIHGYPFPIKYFDKHVLMAHLLKQARENERLNIEELQEKIKNKTVTDADYVNFANYTLFTVDTSSMKDIQRNTLVKQLLTALSHDQLLKIMLIILIVVGLITVYIVMCQQGLVQVPPVKAVCTNIQVPKVA